MLERRSLLFSSSENVDHKQQPDAKPQVFFFNQAYRYSCVWIKIVLTDLKFCQFENWKVSSALLKNAVSSTVY